MLAGLAVLPGCESDTDRDPDVVDAGQERWTTPPTEMPAACLGDEVALEDFFECQIRARCDIALRCVYDFDSEDECLERERFKHRWEPRAIPLERGSLSYDPAAGASCIRAMITEPCTGARDTSCGAAFTTTLAEGDPCFASIECGRSGQCVGCDEGECCQGTCQMAGVPGEACDDETSRCALGLRCDPVSRTCLVRESECASDEECPDQHRCSGDVCIEAVAEGGACYNYGQPGPGALPPDFREHSNCAPGLSCVDRVCQRTDYVGAPCSQYEHCWGGLQCDNVPGATGTCQPQAALGERCGDDITCLGSTRCDMWTQRCVPRSGPGEECDWDWHCSGELRCWWEEGTCNPPKPEGAPCTSGTDECESGLACRSGDDICLPIECYPD